MLKPVTAVAHRRNAQAARRAEKRCRGAAGHLKSRGKAAAFPVRGTAFEASKDKALAQKARWCGVPKNVKTKQAAGRAACVKGFRKMREIAKKELELLMQRRPELRCCENALTEAAELLCRVYREGGKLLCCGNGGSAADAAHIVGELMKSFCLPRPVTEQEKDALLAASAKNGALLAQNLHRALPAVSLVGEISLSTAFANDAVPQLTFAQQVFGLGRAGDALLAISTSGNSENCVYAAETAKSRGMKVIALTGAKESALSALADVTIKAPETETYRIQEYHLPLYHALCLALEAEFFAKDAE